MIGPWLASRFGGKVVKLPLDGGFTCPNRDGTAGTGGCTFCSQAGSGESAVPADSILQQAAAVREKWPDCERYIAYFQNYTSTYAPVQRLRALYESALSCDVTDSGRNAGEIVGLAVATRPDCLPDDVLDLLGELNERTFLWVELGLQTVHADTFNRGYDFPVYEEAVRRLTARGIRVVTHLLFGLPGESRAMMLESVRRVCRDELFGLKFHMLNVVRGSQLGKTQPDFLPFRSPEDYVDLVLDALRIVPPDMTIHRLTGDVPYADLLSPPWAYRKRTVTNLILQEMERRDLWQGMDRERP